MKKTVALILALMMCLPLCACGVSDEVSDEVNDEVSDEVKNAIIAEYDVLVAEMLKDDISSYYINDDFDSISYEINQIAKQRDNEYLVDITWYFNTTDKQSKSHAKTEYRVGLFLFWYLFERITVDGNIITISYTKYNEYDSVRVVENGGSPYSGYDVILEVEGNSGDSGNYGNHTSSKDSFGHDKFDAFVIAEKTVKAQLKSPSTAKFCKTTEATISCSGNTWTVSGWVDAQNSFGATLRNNFTVKFTFSSSDKYTVSSCNIN